MHPFRWQRLLCSIPPATTRSYVGFASAFCFTVLAISTIPAYANTRFVITDLGLLPGTVASDATAINNFGTIVGHAYRQPNPQTGDYTSGYRPFVWNSGVLEALPMPAGVPEAMANALNNRGEIVGTSIGDGFQGRGSGLLWRNGTVGRLNDLPGGTTILGATGINASGEIVGTSAGGELGVNNSTFGTLIRGGMVIPLPSLSTGDWGFATGINDASVIVGAAFNAVVWVDLVPVQLPYHAVGIGSGAEAINSFGDVGGAIVLSQSYMQATIWQSGTPQLIGLPTGFLSSRAMGINDSRQVVGYFRASTETFRLDPRPGDRAFLWENGSVHDLNTVIPAASGWTLMRAADVNDFGQIVGTGIAPNGEYHGFLLTPIPEPRTYMLMVAGTAVVLCFICKRTRCRKRP